MAEAYRPTLSECKAWAATLDGDWGAGGGSAEGLASAQAAEAALYAQQFSLTHLAGASAIKLGSAPADVDAAIDALVPTDLLVRVAPARARQKYEDQAEVLTKAGRALMELWRSPVDVLALIAGDQCLRRVGVGRVMFDDRAWTTAPGSIDSNEALDEWELQQHRHCPIRLEWRDALHCRWRDDRQTGDLLVVVEDYETTVLQAKHAFGAYSATERVLLNRKLDARVRVQDIWFGAYRCLLIEDEPLFPVGRKDTTYQGVAKHGYPEIPYEIAPFRELPFSAPGLRYRGVLTNVASIYEAESQLVTMASDMARFNAWRSYQGWTRDGRGLQVVPGKVTMIDKRFGEYMELNQGEPFSPMVLQLAEALDGARMANGVAPRAGRSQETSRSAQQLQMQQARSEQPVLRARMNLQRFCARSLRKAFMIIQFMLKEPLTLPSPGRDSDGQWLNQVTVGPKDIDFYFDGIKVYFSRRMDPAQLEQAKTLAALHQGKFMPYKAAVEFSGLCDTPGDWQDQLWIEAAESQGFLAEVGAFEKLEAFYKDDNKHQWVVDTYRARLAQEKAQEQQGPGIPAAGAQNPGNMMSGMGGMGGQVAGQMHPAPLPHNRGNQGGAGRPVGGGGAVTGGGGGAP